MKITAVYYVENSSPFHTYTLDVCDVDDNRFVDDDKFEDILWEIFEQERQAQEYPKPSSDVVFLYTEHLIQYHNIQKKYRSTNIAAQLFGE